MKPIDFPEEIRREVAASQDRDSHVELDAHTFHPSQISRCKRQCTKSKFGLDDHDDVTLGRFKIGTMIHEWLEESFADTTGLEMETGIRHDAIRDDDAVTFTGRADCYDTVDNVVYDFKSRSGWYKFDPPDDAHVDQLHVYMAALGARYGQVVYVSKKDLSVKTWPEDDLFEFDPDRYDEIVQRALEIKHEIRENGQPETVEEIPFEPCGCWICNMEGDG